MYYICKFSNSFTLYNEEKHTSRVLDSAEVSMLIQLFPTLLKEKKILTAIKVTEINPNKLQQLTTTDPTPAARS